MIATPESDLRIIRGRRALAELLGVSGQTLWRWQKNGHLPAPLQLGPNCIGWRAVDIAAWQAQRAGAGPA